MEAAAGTERKLFMSSNDLLEQAAKQTSEFLNENDENGDEDINDRKESP